MVLTELCHTVQSEGRNTATPIKQSKISKFIISLKKTSLIRFGHNFHIFFPSLINFRYLFSSRSRWFFLFCQHRLKTGFLQFLCSGMQLTCLTRCVWHPKEDEHKSMRYLNENAKTLPFDYIFELDRRISNFLRCSHIAIVSSILSFQLGCLNVCVTLILTFLADSINRTTYAFVLLWHKHARCLRQERISTNSMASWLHNDKLLHENLRTRREKKYCCLFYYLCVFSHSVRSHVCQYVAGKWKKLRQNEEK